MGLNKRLISAAAAAGSNAVNTENFAPVLYSGNGTSSGSLNPITNVGFQPDLVWIKNRDNANSNFWTDSVRGAGNYLLSNTTDAQDSTSRFNSFDSDGFTVSTDTALLNNSSYDYVAWCWKAGGDDVLNEEGSIDSQVSANQDAGFSIVKYTSTGTNGSTIGHGLSSAPDLVIIKSTTNATNWIVYNFVSGTSKYMYLNSASGDQTFSWFGTSATTFTLNNTFSDANTNGRDYIAYCFHSVDGYQKVGSYTGTGVNGNSVTTGFEPRWLLIKNTTSGTNSSWWMVDAARNTSNPRNNRLVADQNYSETTYTPANLDFDDNGFTLDGSYHGTNALNNVYIYLAIA